MIKKLKNVLALIILCITAFLVFFVVFKFQASADSPLVLNKTADKVMASAGDIITYTINYNAPAAIKNAKIEDALPAKTFYLSGTAKLNGAVKTDISDDDGYALIGNKLTWDLGNLSSGAGGNVSFQIQVPEDISRYGTVGEGGDDTAVFQLALNEASSHNQALYIPAKSNVYLVNPLILPNNTKLLLDSGVTIQAKSGYRLNDSVFVISNVQNVQIIGFGAKITMPKSEYTSGEWRHGVLILGASDVAIRGLTISSTGGDGFYIGASYNNLAKNYDLYSSNIVIADCVSDNNRRQGMSVISVRKLNVERSAFRNTNGTAPQSGIDLEPNYNYQYLEDITIKDSITLDNLGHGIFFAVGKFDSTSHGPIINIINHTDTNPGQDSYIIAGNAFDGITSGKINFTNCESNSSAQWALRILNWSDTNPLISINGLDIKNANTSRVGVDGKVSAILTQNYFSQGATGVIMTFGNFLINNVTINNSENPLDYFIIIRNNVSDVINNVAFSLTSGNGATTIAKVVKKVATGLVSEDVNDTTISY